MKYKTLANGVVVFIQQRDIKSGTGITWFEVGMLQMRTNIDPTKWIPKSLLNAIENGNEDNATNALLKLGDFIAGWERAELLLKEVNTNGGD